KPSAHSFPLVQGVGGWGIAPSARSTPTLWAYAQRNAHKDTPKNKKMTISLSHPSMAINTVDILFKFQKIRFFCIIISCVSHLRIALE
ncbi:MAG: hypothetical protein RML94_13710, partial [Bacteroidia bacterium]|nr:hypothetical protein [Bacteroidia bacterium]